MYLIHFHLEFLQSIEATFICALNDFDNWIKIKLIKECRESSTGIPSAMMRALDIPWEELIS